MPFSTSSSKLSIEFILNEDRERKTQRKKHAEDHIRRANTTTVLTTMLNVSKKVGSVPLRTPGWTQNQYPEPVTVRNASDGAGLPSNITRMNTPHQALNDTSCIVFRCEICLRRFAEKGNLKKHISSVHLKKKKMVCMEPGCGKSFAFRDGLTRHVAHVHKNERPFKCFLCEKYFKQGSHLSKHLRTIHK